MDHLVEVDDVRLWYDERGGGITIKAATREGDPVELSSSQAREIAAALLWFSERDESEDVQEHRVSPKVTNPTKDSSNQEVPRS